MGFDHIDIDRADNESGPHIHGSISLQSLVPTTHTTTTLAETEPYGSTPAGTADEEWRPGVREWLVTICISILVTMDAFNATIIIPLIPNLSTILIEPLEYTLWLNTAYLLANATSQAFLAMLAEGLGHGAVMLSAVVLATVGTGVCGGSPSLPGLVAGRFIQGLGGGGITSISLLLVAEIIPKTHQAQFASYVFRAQIVGTILGPLIGGLFVEFAGWIWVFYSSFVFCALGMLVVPFAVDLRGYGPGYQGVSMRQLRHMDWIGGVLIFLFLGCFACGVSWAGTQYTWTDWQTIVPICVALSLGVLLIVYEAVAPNAMFNGSMFYSMSASMLHVGGFIHGMMISTHLQFLSMYLLLVKGLSSILIGLSLAALTILTPPFLLLLEKIPLFTTHLRIPTWLIRASWTLNILCTGCFVILDAETPNIAWAFVFLAAGVSHAILLPAYVTALQNEAPPPYQQGRERWARKVHALSSLRAHCLFRTWGMCLSVAVAGCVFLNWVGRALPKDEALDMRTLVVAGEIEVYQDAFRTLWKVFTGLAGVGGLSSIFI